MECTLNLSPSCRSPTQIHKKSIKLPASSSPDGSEQLSGSTKETKAYPKMDSSWPTLSKRYAYMKTKSAASSIVLKPPPRTLTGCNSLFNQKNKHLTSIQTPTIVQRSKET